MCSASGASGATWVRIGSVGVCGCGCVCRGVSWVSSVKCRLLGVCQDRVGVLAPKSGCLRFALIIGVGVCSRS